MASKRKPSHQDIQAIFDRIVFLATLDKRARAEELIWKLRSNEAWRDLETTLAHTQKEFLLFTGLTQGSASQYLNAWIFPSRPILEKVAKALTQRLGKEIKIKGPEGLAYLKNSPAGIPGPETPALAKLLQVFISKLRDVSPIQSFSVKTNGTSIQVTYPRIGNRLTAFGAEQLMGSINETGSPNLKATLGKNGRTVVIQVSPQAAPK